MATIEERATAYANNNPHGNPYNWNAHHDAYVDGATDQNKIDVQRAKDAFDKAVGWCRTYPWYDAVVKEFIKAMED